jgi:CDP-6-deoxy-D-xylo-4-hexulose-3-dehydrase
MIKKINWSWPLMHQAIEKSDLLAITKYLKKGSSIKLTHGPNVKKFEKEWSKWLGVKYSVMVNSGASANDLSMKIVKEKYGDGEVIVPPLTWVSDISAVINSGLTPVFVDIDAKTLGISTDAILAAITPKTRAIFITHVLGLNALTTKLLNELKKKKIALIEDVCESHGAKFKNKKVGTFGLLSNFSFYYAHHMTTIEGGMISTNSKEIYDMARSMRSHGLLREIEDLKVRKQISKKYPDLNSEFIFLYPAHNMRPTEIGGILGLSQLKRLSKNIQKRNKNFEFFLSLLDSSKYRTDLDLRGQSNYAFIVILKKSNLEQRNKVETTLLNNGIEFRRGLSGGGNQLRQPYLKKIAQNYNLSRFPNIEHIHNYSWYIGNFPKLEKEKIIDLVRVLNNVS